MNISLSGLSINVISALSQMHFAGSRCGGSMDCRPFSCAYSDTRPSEYELEVVCGIRARSVKTASVCWPGHQLYLTASPGMCKLHEVLRTAP